MTASVLFCSDPLSPFRVDEHFRGQADAVRALGATVALLDHDELVRGNAATAVRRVPRDLGPCWYRGWMVPAVHYAALAQALSERGAHLLTGPAEYQRAHELPGWYETFASVTPRSVWTDVIPTGAQLAELACSLGPGAAIVKDYVKSRKHEWTEACYVSNLEDLADLQAIVSRFVERQEDDLAGGIVLRSFESFVADGPDAGEARVWWLDGEPFLIGPHPDTPEVRPKPDLAEIRPLVEKLSCRFVTTDLARHADGRWRVVEVGDGQVSDLPGVVAPETLARVLVGFGAVR